MIGGYHIQYAPADAAYHVQRLTLLRAAEDQAGGERVIIRVVLDDFAGLNRVLDVRHRYPALPAPQLRVLRHLKRCRQKGANRFNVYGNHLFRLALTGGPAL